MNKFGWLSLLMFFASIISFLLLRGPDLNLVIGIIVLGTLSIFGIVFAILSKKLLPAIVGGVLNASVLLFVFFLLLAKGIGG
ncbi:hypothetical protein [Alkalihalobacillus sp. LMS39]|uniref:hypothetical protein n=1 Tax=Alkalihalobacillus sp. LMS39 TaxID=2924032 RepID=UPI001FB1FAE3|nr:hypothetical protein [Alkalihalobacillus sp. LMS39]UOE94956.1 hypothetical protein MM271_04705 [Alkalihalobacillus sp. LMS39]